MEDRKLNQYIRAFSLHVEKLLIVSLPELNKLFLILSLLRHQ